MKYEKEVKKKTENKEDSLLKRHADWKAERFTEKKTNKEKKEKKVLIFFSVWDRRNSTVTECHI